MACTVLYSLNIGSGVLPQSENVIATVFALTAGVPQRIRIRGHLVATGPVTAGLIVLRVRQGANASGNLIYSTSPGITCPSSGTITIPFEVEDDTNWTFGPIGTGVYVVTANAPQGAGSVIAGYVCAEIVG